MKEKSILEKKNWSDISLANQSKKGVGEKSQININFKKKGKAKLDTLDINRIIRN